jgi:tetratricopeptide (TPR) repeat protein
MLSSAKDIDYLRGVGQSYSTLAGVYTAKGNQGKAIAYYIKAANIFESLGNEILVSKIKHNIGISLLEQDQFLEASNYLQSSHEFNLKENRPKDLIYSYPAMATRDFKLNKDFDNAIEKLKKGEEIAIKRKDTIILGNILNLQGEAYIQYNNNLSLAISRIEESIRLVKIKQSDNHYSLGYSYVHLGKAYLKKKAYNKALIFNDSALIHYKAFNYNKGLRIAYQNRKDILASQGKYKQSIKASELYNQYKDSIFKIDQTRHIARMEPEDETNLITKEKEKAEANVKLAEAVSKQNKSYFVGSAIIAFLIFLASIFYFKRLKTKKKAELITLELKETQKRLAIEKQYRDSELKALKAQMNPHFIFNALNSIQDYIVLNQKNLASDYLGKFADLIRNYLHFSDTGFISVQDEVHNLNLYLELEKLRFEDVLEYTFNISEDANSDAINIPTMLIQPYIENALKHGLLHKKDNRKLNISISKISDKIIECIIEDNGIGRKKSKEINRKRESEHKSFALKATTERLDLLNYSREKKIGVTFIDLKGNNEKATGTKVILKIPILKK